MDGGPGAYNPRTAEEVFRDFRGRRAGMIKALTTGIYFSVSIHELVVSLSVCYIMADGIIYFTVLQRWISSTSFAILVSELL